jgi:hypothetical protein
VAAVVLEDPKIQTTPLADIHPVVVVPEKKTGSTKPATRDDKERGLLKLRMLRRSLRMTSGGPRI